jgi:hypothetical protein
VNAGQKQRALTAVNVRNAIDRLDTTKRGTRGLGKDQGLELVTVGFVSTVSDKRVVEP